MNDEKEKCAKHIGIGWLLAFATLACSIVDSLNSNMIFTVASVILAFLTFVEYGYIVIKLKNKRQMTNTILWLVVFVIRVIKLLIVL